MNAAALPGSRRAPWRAICAVTALFAIAGLALSCTADPDGATATSELVSLRYHDDGGSLPPDAHRSMRLTLQDGQLERVEFASYEEIEVDRMARPLSQRELAELSTIVRAADLAEVDEVDDLCTGIVTHSLSLQFDDRTSLGGRMDDRTFRGEQGRCRSFSLSGQMESVVTHLNKLLDGQLNGG